MNILPKKKWHVRTKENVARVRSDQKRAREEEKRVAERAQLAEQEYKVNLLRKNAERMETIFRCGESGSYGSNAQFINSSGHINLFANLEAEYRKNLGVGNRDYKLEKKKEQEEYEKKVGILQYLGEGSCELTKEKPWYEKIPTKKESESRKSEIPTKKGNELAKSENRSSVKMFRKRIGSTHQKIKEKEHKMKRKNKGSRYKKCGKKSTHYDCSSLEISSSEEKSSKKQKLEKLRQERLDREAKEQKRFINLLIPSESNKEEMVRNVAKYNSQFNPALARQNQTR